MIRSIVRYDSRRSQIRYTEVLSRRIGTDKGGGQIRLREILIRTIGIDACGGGCIRLRDNRSLRIVRDSSGNCWVR